MTWLREVDINIADNTGDSFERLPVATPTAIFDAQFTYDLQPLLYEEVKTGSGADITHDSTNRRAEITFSSTPTGNVCYLQTFEHFRYQPGKSQQIYITSTIGAAVTNTRCFAGYYDPTGGSGYFFSQELNGSLYFNIATNTTAGDQVKVQSDWNIDKLDGTGLSGKTLDITKTQILVIDFQALYVGRVRFGFNIDGQTIWCHQFLNANVQAYPYVDTANLPISVGMVSSGGTVTRTMHFNCCSVISNGGQDDTTGYEFSQAGSVTASSGARTHLLSLRPKTTFNSITNRYKFTLLEVDVLVTGVNAVLWELVIGQAISGTTTFNDVNATYSGTQYNTAGTISGSPAIVVDSGYVAASATSRGRSNMKLTTRYPITLDYNGAVRSLGTVSLLVTGIGGTSACNASIKFREVR